ncbi:CopG family transcriptional regulator [Mycolicibacterium sp. HS_4_1]
MDRDALKRLIDEEVAAAEATEELPDDGAPLPPHVKVSRPNRARAKVLKVWLNPGELDALEAIASERRLPVSTLARAQLLDLIAKTNRG